MKTETLSEAALALFCLHVEREGRIDVDDANRESYRELGSYYWAAPSQARRGTTKRLG